MWRSSDSPAAPTVRHLRSTVSDGRQDEEGEGVVISSSMLSPTSQRRFKRRRLLPIHHHNRSDIRQSNGLTQPKHNISDDSSYSSSSGASDSDDDDFEEYDRTVTPSPEPPYKRVRFVPTLVSMETTVDRFDSNHPELKKQDLWWNKDDRTTFMGVNRSLLNDFQSSHNDKVKHYLQVFERCSDPPSEATSEYLEQATVQIPSSVRGLEVFFCSPLKDRRKSHVQDVLNAQDQLYNGDDGSQRRVVPNADLCMKILGSRSLQSSRPCRIMARLIGEGDAASCAEDSKKVPSILPHKPTTPL